MPELSLHRCKRPSYAFRIESRSDIRIVSDINVIVDGNKIMAGQLPDGKNESYAVGGEGWSKYPYIKKIIGKLGNYVKCNSLKILTEVRLVCLKSIKWYNDNRVEWF